LDEQVAFVCSMTEFGSGGCWHDWQEEVYLLCRKVARILSHWSYGNGRGGKSVTSCIS